MLLSFDADDYGRTARRDIRTTELFPQNVRKFLDRYGQNEARKGNVNIIRSPDEECYLSPLYREVHSLFCQNLRETSYSTVAFLFIPKGVDFPRHNHDEYECGFSTQPQLHILWSKKPVFIQEWRETLYTRRLDPGVFAINTLNEHAVLPVEEDAMFCIFMSHKYIGDEL